MTSTYFRSLWVWWKRRPTPAPLRDLPKTHTPPALEPGAANASLRVGDPLSEPLGVTGGHVNGWATAFLADGDPGSGLARVSGGLDPAAPSEDPEVSRLREEDERI